ncbi:hypothetical protein DFJ74DRAFT_652924 [Hyaloraphidium curvatum]|nr:hypothetical protein DFJ74DRAFT_652924 [Hyaloraphidium curvatum]
MPAPASGKVTVFADDSDEELEEEPVEVKAGSKGSSTLPVPVTNGTAVSGTPSSRSLAVVNAPTGPSYLVAPIFGAPPASPLTPPRAVDIDPSAAVKAGALGTVTIANAPASRSGLYPPNQLAGRASPTRSEISYVSDVSGLGALPRELRELYASVAWDMSPGKAPGKEPDLASLAESVEPEEELMDAILLLESAKNKLSPVPSAVAMDTPPPELPTEFPAPDLSTPYDPAPTAQSSARGATAHAPPPLRESRTAPAILGRFLSLNRGSAGRSRPPAVAPARTEPGVETLFDDAEVDGEGEQRPKWKMLLPPFQKGQMVRDIGYFWSMAQMVIITALEISLMVMLVDIKRNYLYILGPSSQGVINADSLLVYQAIYIFGLIFQFILYIDADFSKSSIQLLSFLVFEILLWGNALVQFFQGQTLLTPQESAIISQTFPSLNTRPARGVEASILALNTVFFAGWPYLVWKLYQAYGWEIYKQFGADLALRKRVILQHIFLTLLKLDVFFYLGFDVQIIALVSGNTRPPQTADILQNALITIPLTVLIIVFGYYGAVRNSIWMTCVFLAGTVAAIIYAVLKLVDVYRNPGNYVGVQRSLTLFICITIVLGIATWVVSVLNLLQYKEGKLKDLVERNKANLEMARQRKWSIED